MVKGSVRCLTSGQPGRGRLLACVTQSSSGSSFQTPECLKKNCNPPRPVTELVSEPGSPRRRSPLSWPLIIGLAPGWPRQISRAAETTSILSAYGIRDKVQKNALRVPPRPCERPERSVVLSTCPFATKKPFFSPKSPLSVQEDFHAG